MSSLVGNTPVENTPVEAIPEQYKSLISTPSCLLFGSTGTGKTYAIPTLLQAGLEVFVAITEPNGLDSLIDSCRRRNIPIDKLHWKILPPTKQGFKGLSQTAKIVNSMSFSDITKMSSGIGKSSCQQYITFLDTISNFVSDRDGKEYGDVTTWDDTRAFVIDSLSGLMKMVQQNVLGTRPVVQLAEYGIIQNVTEQLIDELVSINAFLVITAHINRIQDEISGEVKISTWTIGNKLSPRMPTFFSEAIYAQRKGDQFFWSTVATGVDSKNRALPIGDNLEASFVPVVTAHRERKKWVMENFSGSGVAKTPAQE